MKKLLVVGAILAASSVFMLSACSGCAGCGGATSSALALRSNWFAQVTTKTIQPTFIEGNDHFQKEEITYSVSLEKGNNSTYSVEYTGAIYSTEFYATSFPRNLIASEYATTYPTGEITAYCYKTNLVIPTVTYTFNETNETVTRSNDRVTTISYFLSAGNQLRPLYSHQEIVSSSPATFQPTAATDMFNVVSRSYDNYYEFSGASVKSAITINPEDYSSEESFDKVTDKDAGETIFDYSSLNIALRSLNLTTSLSQSISIFSPSNGVQSFEVRGADTALGEEERTAVTAKLKEKGLFKDKTDLAEGEKNEVSTVAVNVSLSADVYTGTSQTLWFAAIDNSENNTGRATLLKIATPLAYSLGTITYSLETITSTFWNE